jgi:D-citramalate synthase
VNAARPFEFRFGNHAHPRGPVTGRDQPDLETPLSLERTDHECAIEFIDAMLPKGSAQALPGIFLRRNEQYARSTDVEPMDDPTTQTALPHAVDLGKSGDHRIQHGVDLILSKRVHGTSGGLVDREPAASLREHPERLVQSGQRPLVFRPRKGGHLDDGPRLKAQALGVLIHAAPTDAHGAAREQPTHLRTREPQALGEKPVESLAAIFFLDRQRLAGLGHEVRLDCLGFRRQSLPVDSTGLRARFFRPDSENRLKRMDENRIAVMDTTLRDGEQTPDVSYFPAEKLQLARLLLTEVGVDRIEIASTRVSESERESARLVVDWARKKRMLPRVEILGYCDASASVNWIASTGGKVMNLLTKGSERHCRVQLGLTPEEHRNAVTQTFRAAKRKRLVVNAYLEDWSNGVRDSFDYVFAMVELLRDLGTRRIYLADTLGIMSPQDVTRYVDLMVSTWPDLVFEFHAHNDYGLAAANVLASVRAGARGVHTSVNGLGERTGNARLAEIVAAIHDHTKFQTGVQEARLSSLSRLVETFSGKDVADNTPIVGRDVYTQTAGIHADGDAKGELYASQLLPARFGERRRYALGKLSGKASLEHNLKALGIALGAEEKALVLQRIVEIGERKNRVSIEDLPYIIADVLKSPADQRVRVESYRVVVGTNETPQAEIVLAYRKKKSAAKATGGGGYDAFMNAIRNAAHKHQLEVTRQADFRVRIPPGGRTTALVETVITWKSEDDAEDNLTTLGVDSDQLAAAVIATEKMLNAIALRPKPSGKRS